MTLDPLSGRKVPDKVPDSEQIAIILAGHRSRETPEKKLGADAALQNVGMSDHAITFGLRPGAALRRLLSPQHINTSGHPPEAVNKKVPSTRCKSLGVAGKGHTDDD